MKKFKKFSCLLRWSDIEVLEKIKDLIVRSRLHPLERNVDCGGCGNDRFHVYKDTKVTDTFVSFTVNKCY